MKSLGYTTGSGSCRNLETTPNFDGIFFFFFAFIISSFKLEFSFISLNFQNLQAYLLIIFGPMLL